MLNKTFESKYLEWDSRYFGVPSARIFLNQVVDSQTQEELLNLFQKYEFVTISNIDNHYENNYWIGSKTDAFLTDINIRFKKKIKGKLETNNSDIYITNMMPEDRQMVSISKKAFKHSRFHNDPNLDQKKARDIYSNWVKNSFEKENKYFVVSKKNEKVTGFILFSLEKDKSNIELIAVDEKYQGQKIGKSLLFSMESYLKKTGIREINVGTQVNNISAMKFYNANGFSYVGCSSVYHIWSN